MTGPPDALSPALEAALRRYADVVRRTGYRHGLSGADLDEVVQGVRIRLWKALQNGERIAAVTPFYVQRTAMSAALDLIRERRYGREVAVSESTTPAAGVRGPRHDSPADRLDQSEIEARVASAIGMLTESRQPVVRMYLAGYNSEEIAGVFGWTEAKARNLLYRGLADLRARLTGWGITPETLT